jgi:hypothetical protein
MTTELIHPDHHAACLDNGVSCLPFFEHELVRRFIGYRGSDDLSADIDANMGRSSSALLDLGDLAFELVSRAQFSTAILSIIAVGSGSSISSAKARISAARIRQL